jgi:anti-anti-sigma factor
MPEQANLNCIEIDHAGNATIVRFVESLILTGTTAEAVSDELSRLLEGGHRVPLILNFENVRSLTSLMLGKLIQLNKKANARGGRLAVCGLCPDLQELFEVTQLHEYLDIHANEQDAVQALQDR